MMCYTCITDVQCPVPWNDVLHQNLQERSERDWRIGSWHLEVGVGRVLISHIIQIYKPRQSHMTCGLLTNYNNNNVAVISIPGFGGSWIRWIYGRGAAGCPETVKRPL